ncbi:MAG: hypothetical protein ABFD13_03055 [Candidatus Cryosericum sp.]|nr:DUF2325 domain-containing protein [bacterium]
MDEKDKARLAQALKGQLSEVKRPGPVIPAARSPVRPDLTPFALAACAANVHLHHHIDEALRHAEPVWNAQVAGSMLVRHPALMTLPAEEASYAFRLVGVMMAAEHDQQARSCLGEIVRDGWRPAWQTVTGGENISLERFRVMHPSKVRQEPDVEALILTWYAGIRGVAVADSPMREALDQSLIRELHRLSMVVAETDTASRSRYLAALRYGHAWWRAIAGNSGDEALAIRLSAARDVVGQVTHVENTDFPASGDIWSTAFLLATADPELDDGTAVSMLVGLSALRRQCAEPSVVPSEPMPPLPRASTGESELRKARAELASQLREVHRLSGELERTRERLSMRETEISRLMGILAARREPEAEVQYTVHTITERILIVGGHETLSRNLQTWLPNSVCIPMNGKEDLDPTVLSTTRLVVVLTSYISHSFSGKVINEAHKRDLPVLMLDWRNAKHILQEIDRALTVQQDP